jgi:DNA-directed RNA polymerase specialized sigma24 family protein
MDLEPELDLTKKNDESRYTVFRLLVESHQVLAYSIAFRFTRDEQDSEDIVQEALLSKSKFYQLVCNFPVIGEPRHFILST